MKKLNLPAYNFKFKTVNQKTQIFDSIRKKYIALTPEEWVRQNFICFLVEEKKYPASLIAVESGLKYLSQKKRTDIVIYSNLGKPIVIVECKAPEVAIKEETFEQISRYNSTLKIDLGIVTNGIQHYCFKIDYQQNRFDFLTDIPSYEPQ